MDEGKPDKPEGSKKPAFGVAKEHKLIPDKIPITIASQTKAVPKQKLSITATYPAVATPIAAPIAKDSEVLDKYSDMKKSSFSDSLFDTKTVVQKTLEKVRETEEKKKHPFTGGLFGGASSATNLLKNIGDKVDLPENEFKEKKEKPVVTEEAKLADSLKNTII